MTHLTVEWLRSFLRYDKRTGVFTRRTPRGARGVAIGSLNPNGYVVIKLKGRTYPAHRLAWFYVHGHWPVEDIDHKFGVRNDNRLSQLRSVTRSCNQENQRKARSNNKVGLLGVSWHVASKMWRAQIKVKGVVTHLGCFPDPHAAHSAYVKAKRELHEGCTI